MTPERIEKPWGSEVIIANKPENGCKLLTVKQGHRLSLQRHQQRDAMWYVLSGNAHVTLNSFKMVMRPGSMVSVPRNTWHRLGTGKSDVQIIEVTNGYVAGDIERKEDDYGRKGQTD